MRSCPIKQEGFTLVEVLMVMIVIGILVTIATMSFNTMTTKANIESQIKQMHADLMTARIWAMDRNTCHFAVLNANGSYSIYEDANSNCQYDAGVDTLLLSKTATNPALWNNASASGNYIIFDNRGLATVSTGSVPLTISIADTVSAAFDCLLIETTRTSMGQMSGGNCVPQ